jgi:MFS family permease
MNATKSNPFFGWTVVAGVFCLASFGWGLGFYGPPIYLQALQETRGWPVSLVSAAVTTHYLCGALVIAGLPRLYRRFGLQRVTRIGSVSLAIGLVGWAVATAPWHLFAATVLTGCGWVTMGAAAVNAILSPWFVEDRPKALSTAYNGASVGGIIFSPLWAILIGTTGFPAAALMIGGVSVLVVWGLTARIFRVSPQDLGQNPDGRPAQQPPASSRAADVIKPLPGPALWRDFRFRTLSAGMALGLVAQIGLLAHLYSLVVPVLGNGMSGIVMGSATASAILGRTAFGWLMPAGADRRIAAVTSLTVQIAGSLLLILSGADCPPLIVGGIVLIGFGLGNATSLPPLIAQVEFARQDSGRVVALIVAIAQASYAFAPAGFGFLRASLAWSFPEMSIVGCAAIAIQCLAIIAYLAGRGPRRPSPRKRAL